MKSRGCDSVILFLTRYENIAIMRAFVHLRELIVTHKDLARRIDEVERRYDGKFAASA
jgi:hypothetical protein